MSPVREVTIVQVDEYSWQFNVAEDEKLIYASDTYTTTEKCAECAMRFLDILHDEKPLRNDTIPRWTFEKKGRKIEYEND